MAVTTVFYTNYRELSLNYQFLSWDALRAKIFSFNAGIISQSCEQSSS